MAKLSLRTWIRNAAAVFSGQHGAITRQAEQAACSRETVYQHARKLEQRLGTEPAAEAAAELHAENRRLRRRIAELERAAEGSVRCDKAKRRRLATTAFAMGLSLRQIEDLLGIPLPAAEAPDHSTLGQWVGAEARRAGAVPAALDPACALRVRTLALDEVFFGGGRPWWGSSRRAGRPSSAATPPTVRPRPGASNRSRSTPWSSPSPTPPRGSPRRSRTSPRPAATPRRLWPWSAAWMPSPRRWKPGGSPGPALAAGRGGVGAG